MNQVLIQMSFNAVKQPKRIKQKFDPKKSEHKSLPTYETPSPSSFFGRFTKTQEATRAVSWDSSYYFMLNGSNNVCLERAEFYGGADDGPRDGGMDVAAGTYPTVEIDYAFYLAQRRESSLLEKDDWIAVQEVASIEKGLGDIVLVGVLADQVFYHKWLPSSPEDDALGANYIKWTENSLSEAIQRLLRNGYTMHPIAVNMLKTLLMYWHYDSPYMRRGMPGGIWLPHRFKPMTYANWITTYKYLKGISPTAGLHYKRIKIEPVAFSESMLVHREIDMHSDFGKFMRMIDGVIGKDGGGNNIYGAYGTSIAGVFAWANIDLYAKVNGQGEQAEFPENYFAMLSFFNAYYDATNQYCIKVGNSATTNSYVKILNSNFNQNTAPAVEFVGTDLFRIKENIPMISIGCSLSMANGGAALTDTDSQDQEIARLFGKTHTKIDNPYSEAIWDEMVIDSLRYLRKQALW